MQAARAGADEALMLDPHGFVATCNSTHFFIVRRGEIWTSSGNYCLDGITRGTVLQLGHALEIPVREKSFSRTLTISKKTALQNSKKPLVSDGKKNSQAESLPTNNTTTLSTEVFLTPSLILIQMLVINLI
jgi:hypothetical protein